MKIKYLLTIIMAGALVFGATSCVRASKTCKKNQKKVKNLRKSGALKM